MCEDITNLLLSVGINDDRDFEEVNKKQRIRRAKTRAKLKSQAVTAISMPLNTHGEKGRKSILGRFHKSVSEVKDASRPLEGETALEEEKNIMAKDEMGHTEENMNEKTLKAEELSDSKKENKEEATEGKEEMTEKAQGSETVSADVPHDNKVVESKDSFHGNSVTALLNDTTHLEEKDTLHMPRLDLSKAIHESSDSVVLPSLFRAWALITLVKMMTTTTMTVRR